MAAGAMPRMSRTEPWDLIAAFNDDMQKQAAQEKARQLQLQRDEAERAAVLERIRLQSSLGDESWHGREGYKRKIELEDRPYEERQKELQTDRAIRQGVETAKGSLRAQMDAYKENPEFYGQYRKGGSRSSAVDRVPEHNPGDVVIPLANAMDLSMAQSQYGKTHDIRTEVNDAGKSYIVMTPKKPATPTDNNGAIAPPKSGTAPGVTTGKTDARVMPDPGRPATDITVKPNPSAVPGMDMESSSQSGWGGAERSPGWIDPPPEKNPLLPSGEDFRARARSKMGIPERNWSTKPDKLSLMPQNSGLVADLYNAYRKAGMSDAGARAFLAEVGRENDFNPQLIFGSHSDPANAQENIGPLSWQKERRVALMKRLGEEGLLRNGRPIPSQDTLDVFAEFTRDEMQQMHPKLASYLSRDNIDYNTATRELGRNYIKWRYDDPVYRSHHGRRDQHYEDVTNFLEQRRKASVADPTARRPQVVQTEDPDIFDVMFA